MCPYNKQWEVVMFGGRFVFAFEGGSHWLIFCDCNRKGLQGPSSFRDTRRRCRPGQSGENMPLLKGHSYISSTSHHYGQWWAFVVFMWTLQICFKVGNHWIFFLLQLCKPNGTCLWAWFGRDLLLCNFWSRWCTCARHDEVGRLSGQPS